MARHDAEAATGDAIRVLVDNGEYWLNNKGDLAMLDVTVRRLRSRWPNARIGVLTYEPSLLRAFVPDAEPVSYRRRGGWSRPGPLGQVPAHAGPRVVGPLSQGWRAATDGPRHSARRIRDTMRDMRRPGRPEGHGGARPAGAAAPATASPATGPSGHGRIPLAVRDASLVLAMGGGYMTDVDLYQAHRTLDLLEHAADLGIPTVMTGQGLGPMEDPELVARAAKVLPRVDFIALREGLQGPGLLARLGMPPERVLVTGDDAVELAYDRRSEEIASGIGVCLRVAVYSPVAARAQDVVGRVVRGFGSEVGAGLVPLIVSEHGSEDRRSTLPLLAGYPNVTPPLGRFAGPGELASRVSRCRMLVTGAYHVAVFALSQGIPVVGLSSSQYYDDKFHGLAGMFGTGVHLVRLDGDGLEERLVRAVRLAWAEAPGLRSPLRENARAQIRAGRQGFERVFELVEPGRTTAS